MGNEVVVDTKHYEAESVVIRVGSFECAVDRMGHGTVKVDGVELPFCTAFTVTSRVGDIARVTIESLCLERKNPQ